MFAWIKKTTILFIILFFANLSFAADQDFDSDNDSKIDDTYLDLAHDNTGVLQANGSGDVTAVSDNGHIIRAGSGTVCTDQFITKTSSYTIGTDSVCECYGGVIYVTSAAVITACDSLDDEMSFSVITIGAIEVSLDVQSDDKMILDGTTLDDGDKATNTSTTGDLIVCTYYSADGWYCASGSNDGDLWTDDGA